MKNRGQEIHAVDEVSNSSLDKYTDLQLVNELLKRNLYGEAPTETKRYGVWHEATIEAGADETIHITFPDEALRVIKADNQFRDLTSPMSNKQELIEMLVYQFLQWKLPDDFSPDGFISFQMRPDNIGRNDPLWPVGTNLLTAEQARKMFTELLALVDENVFDATTEE